MTPPQRRLRALLAQLQHTAGLEPTPTAGAAEEEEVPLHHRLSQIPTGPRGPRTTLTPEEKRQFYRDGFLILRGVVPRELTARARKRWNSTPAAGRGGTNAVGSRLGTSPEITDLINKSSIAELLRREMGPFTPPLSGMVAVTPPVVYGSAEELPAAERPHSPWPEYGFPGLHVDGFWSGRIPASQAELDVATGRPRDVAKYFGDDSAKVQSKTNMGLLWMDKEKRLSLGSFTAFVFVALNDQTVPGRGQTAVLPGAHRHVEEFFKMQADHGGVVGPEGPGWPRLIPVGKDGVMLNPLPAQVIEKVAEGSRQAAGLTWPKPTPVLMEEGDCAILLHACPHGASVNFGPDPRMNIIFRIRRLREGDPNEGTRRQGTGTSDHPDRGFFGQFLEYPPGYDPFKLSIDKMCDHWSEWDGMREVVAEERAKEASTKER